MKNAFQNYIPFTIAGAVGILWSSVIVNDTSGLGALWKPIMVLDFLNPAFDAIQYFCISCITVGIVIMLSIEMARENNEDPIFSVVLCVAGWVAVTDTTSGGIPSTATNAQGMFCGLIMVFFISWLFHKLRHVKQLKIAMPEQVPEGVAKTFELMIPIILVVVICGFLSLAVQMVTNGLYLNDIIYAVVQGPLMMVGGSLGGFIVLTLVKQLFWCIGIHGGNLVGSVMDALWLPLMAINMENFANGAPATNIVTTAFNSLFTNIGGGGCTIALLIVILVFSKRAGTRALCKLSLVPSLFNVNEPVIFGMPIVMNPVLCIPFIIAPIVSGLIGYFLTLIGFCPVTVALVPWTTPPIIGGFLATGGSINGAITQALCIVVCIFIYLPFFVAYEKQAAQEDAEAVE